MRIHKGHAASLLLVIVWTLQIVASLTSDQNLGSMSEQPSAPFRFVRRPNTEEFGAASLQHHSLLPSLQKKIRKPRQLRIVNGHNVTTGEIPYQLSLQYNNSHLCGAVIVDDKGALTAAHCFSRSQTPSMFRVVAGENDLILKDGHEQFVQVEHIIIHSAYNATSNENDIAYLRLEQNISFNNPAFVNKVTSIQGINGVNISLTPATRVTVSGWGLQKERDRVPSRILRQVTLNLTAHEACKEVYKVLQAIDVPNEIKESMLCAHDPANKADACQGDSGGPLVVRSNNDAHILVGLTSWAYGCGRMGWPSVYTSVSSYADWIQKQIHDAKYSNSRLYKLLQILKEFNTKLDGILRKFT